MKYGTPLLLLAVSSCSEVIVEDDPALRDGEGGYLGTGESDIDAAVGEVCDLLEQRRPDCPQETCVEAAYNFFERGEQTGCGAEAVALMYCSVENADDVRCLGHHDCDAQYEAYDACWKEVCGTEPERCSE
jgi:hypothetical protein